MSNKEKFQNLVKGAQDLSKKAGQVGKDVAAAAGVAKGAVQKGVSTGKAVFEKAAEIANKETLGKGLDAASKGIDVAAKGAQLASKGVGKLADTMKKASHTMKDASNKMKK